MSMSLPLITCYCNYVYICVCKTPKFEFLTDTPVSLPTSSEYPNSGYRLMHGYLLSRGHRITQARIRDSLHRVDPEGIVIRWASAVQRRKYTVRFSSSLWHIDGNH